MATSIECPRCGKNVVLSGEDRSPHAPFCSKRCRMSDLGAWSDGDYVIGRPLKYDDLEEADFDERGVVES